MAFLDISDLHFAYGAQTVFEGLSLNVERGEFLGLIGPNGSGKTTLIKLISRTLAPNGGTILFDGRDIRSMKSREIARRIAVVPQESNIIFPFTVTEIVLMGRSPHLSGMIEKESDVTIAREAMGLTDTLEYADRFISELSGGEKQRVIIARALAQNPSLLLLDEPTAFLDIKHQIDIYDLVKRLNRDENLTVITVSHDLNLAAQYCERLLLLRDGIYTDGTPTEVITRSNIRDVYDAEVHVGCSEVSGLPFVLPLSEKSRKLLDEIEQRVRKLERSPAGHERP